MHGSILQLRQCHDGPAALTCDGALSGDAADGVSDALVGVTDDSVVVDTVRSSEACCMWIDID